MVNSKCALRRCSGYQPARQGLLTFMVCLLGITPSDYANTFLSAVAWFALFPFRKIAK
jgi:hypothetical protein